MAKINKKLRKELENLKKESQAENTAPKLFFDYPKEPIGGSNPYWMCSHCGRSDPQINGRLEGHSSHCQFRIENS